MIQNTLKQFNLNFKDQHVLGRYSEALLRAAIDDLNAYRSWDKEVYNIAAFLMGRCKAHQKNSKVREQKAIPSNIKEWLTGYFKARKRKFVFISKGNQVDQSTNESRPFIQLLWHKHDIHRLC